MTVSLWFALWLFGTQSQGLSFLQGTVVRSGSAQPLANEQVGLWPTNRLAVTDAFGRFTFTNTPAGTYAFVVVHEGIKARVPFSLTAGARLDNFTIEVPAAPAISGAIFAPNGEPAAAARVEAFRLTYAASGPQLRRVRSVLTNDLGEYRFFELQPGDYYVAANFSQRDRRLASAGLQLTPNLSELDNSPPTMYFGNAYTKTQAQKIRLGRNTEAQGINIFLVAGRRYSVSGRLAGAGGDACGRLAVVPEGSFLDPETDFDAEVCGGFRVPDLSPGTYTLFASNKGANSEAIRISVANRNVEGVLVNLLPAVTLSGRVLTDSGAASLGRVRVVLERDLREVQQRIETAVRQDGYFEMRNLGPGQYNVYVDPLPQGTYVRSIRYGAQDAILLPLPITSRTPLALNIQLSTGPGIVEGIALDQKQQPVPGATVVLAPRTGRNRKDRYTSVVADAAGNFRLGGLPPGSYVAFAFEDIAPDEWLAFAYDPALLTRYTPRGQVLNLDTQGSQSLRLSTIPAVDTAGGLH